VLKNSKKKRNHNNVYQLYAVLFNFSFRSTAIGSGGGIGINVKRKLFLQGLIQEV
jgi:hypothetical protein